MMKGFLGSILGSRGLGWSAAFFAGALCLVAQNTGVKIARVEVSHIGPPAVSEALIRANIRVKEGDPYSRTAIDEDVRNLYSTKYFYNIRVTEETVTNGISVTYVLQGNPTVTDINVVGNKKFTKSKIMKKITAKVGEPLNEPGLFNDKLEIQKMYQKSGLQKTEVEPIPNIDENTARATVTFQIHESPKVRIEDVQFEGASAFEQKKLRKVIKTRRHWWLSFITGSGVLKDEQLEDDRERLADFYRNEGYIDFEIKDVKYDYTAGNKMVLKFEIYEGKQYRVGNIQFKGNKLFTEEQLRPVLRMSIGQIFTPKKLAADREAIEDYYGSRGYIGEGSERHIPIRAIRNANIEASTMDLVYEVVEGEKSFIEKIEIRGNNRTKDKVIRRELAVSPGEVFDMVKVKRSRERLDLMGYFSKVETSPEPTDVPNRKDLVVNLEEQSTGDINFGAGFSSVDSVIGFVGVNQGNFDLFNPPYFTGGGQKFRLLGTVGNLRQDYELSFTEPWLFNRKLALDVDLYHREARYLSDFYNERRTGARFGLRRAILERTRRGIPELLEAGISYNIENVNLDFNADKLNATHPDSGSKDQLPDYFKADEGTRWVSKFGLTLQYDTQRGYLSDRQGRLIGLPSHGQITELHADLAGGPFGGDTDFYLVEARSSWYFPGFFKGHVLEVRGRAGVVDSFGSSDRVPLFDRFFLGGAYSLRGFDFRDVGPKIHDVDPAEDDQRDEPVGGNSYFFGSLEYSLPIVERLRFAVFYDIGNVYVDPYAFHLDRYNDNFGFGIRINITPRMPLRLDYGIPIRTDRFNDSSGRFNFSVGYKSRN